MLISVVKDGFDMRLRKHKRKINHLRKKIPVGGYFLACDSIPAKCTEKDFYTNDLYGNGVLGNSLLDGHGCSCSLWYCSPEPLTKERAYELIECYKNNSWAEYQVMLHGGSLEYYEEMDKVWNFSKRKQIKCD